MNGHATARGSIVGVVSAVPARVIRNADCPDPAAADEAAKLTGVNERRWVSSGQSARTLCTDAAKRLMLGLGWKDSSIDVLVYVTQTPDGAVPADVYRIAADLGITGACLQVNWSCAGYVYGLWTTMRLLQPGQRALLLVGDATSTIADPSDRATAPLFGDAGSATAIIGSDLDQHFVLGTDARGVDRLCQASRGFLHMNGAEVFSYTLRTVPRLAADVLTSGRPDFWLLHQANAFMLKHLAKKASLEGPIPTNIERFGNCSSASIPLLMCSELGGEMMVPQRLGMLGYGAGWAHAGASIMNEGMQACELIEV